jgi:hypothetical protein
MGTPNFARPSNASKYYAVLTNQEVEVKCCPECEHKHPDWEYTLETLSQCEQCECDLTEVEVTTEEQVPEDWECEDLIDNIGVAIEAIGGKAENESFNDRNYERQSLGTLESNKSYGDIDFNVKLTAVLQSAYYEGATLDYIIQIEANGEDFDYSTGSYYDQDLDSILDVAFDQCNTEMNAGLCKILQPKAQAWIESQIETLSNQLEAVYEDWAQHKLGCTGVFSNGEAIYHEVA